MKKINGYESLYLTESGQLYDEIKQTYKKPYQNRYFKLSGNKTVSLKSLYKQTYNKTYCLDTIQNLDREQWKQYKDTDYYISSFGRVKSYKGIEAKLLQQYSNKKGYKYIQIMINGKKDSKYIHRLVAECFINYVFQKDINYYQIHHINGIRNDNIVQNLTWIEKQKHKLIHAKDKTIQR